MNAKNKKTLVVTPAGLNLRTDLHTGIYPIRSLGEFVKVFMSNSLTPANFPKLQAGLEKTNEQCKQAGGNNKCDEWASNFGLIFAHG